MVSPLTEQRTHTIIDRSAEQMFCLYVNAGHSPDAHFIVLSLQSGNVLRNRLGRERERPDIRAVDLLSKMNRGYEEERP